MGARGRARGGLAPASSRVSHPALGVAAAEAARVAGHRRDRARLPPQFALFRLDEIVLAAPEAARAKVDSHVVRGRRDGRRRRARRRRRRAVFSESDHGVGGGRRGRGAQGKHRGERRRKRGAARHRGRGRRGGKCGGGGKCGAGGGGRLQHRRAGEKSGAGAGARGDPHHAARGRPPTRPRPPARRPTAAAAATRPAFG